MPRMRSRGARAFGRLRSARDISSPRARWVAAQHERRSRPTVSNRERYHALERRLHSQVAETRARLLANRLELDHARLEAERASLEAALLRRLATMLRASVRPSDLVARVGGEEFL